MDILRLRAGALDAVRRLHRSDTTQTEIVAALRQVGARVWVIGGTVDAAILYHGRVYLMDFKSRGGRLTDDQRDMLTDGWPIHCPTTVGEALAAIRVRVT